MDIFECRKSELVAFGNAIGWEQAIVGMGGRVAFSTRRVVEGDASYPRDEKRLLHSLPAAVRQLEPTGVFVAAFDEDNATRDAEDQILAMLRSGGHNIDLIVLESLFGSRESSELSRVDKSRSAGYRSLNRVAIAATHLGYQLDVRWLAHAEHGASVSRVRCTALLKKSRDPRWPSRCNDTPNGWQREFALSSFAEPTWFSETKPSPKQIELLQRDWWRERLKGQLPCETGQAFMLHPSYSGGSNGWKVAPIRWANEEAYPVTGRIIVFRDRFYEMRRKAIACLCGFREDEALQNLTDNAAIDLMSKATDPRVAAGILWQNVNRSYDWKA